LISSSGKEFENVDFDKIMASLGCLATLFRVNVENYYDFECLFITVNNFLKVNCTQKGLWFIDEITFFVDK
jgi:hypothetical protein